MFMHCTFKKTVLNYFSVKRKKDMFKSIIGTKIGITQVFDESGEMVPVTVVNAGPCVITKVLTKEKNGYNAVQVGFIDIKEKKLNKPELGIFKKANITPKKVLKEIRMDDVMGCEVGQLIKADVFKSGDFVDVTGFSVGKGFAGTIKRHGFHRGPATHGQSNRERSPGSIGAQQPQHVIKGKKMSGRLGNEKVTIQKLRVFQVDADKNLILIEGSVPGIETATIVIKRTVKKISQNAGAKQKSSAKPVQIKKKK